MSSETEIDIEITIPQEQLPAEHQAKLKQLDDAYEREVDGILPKAGWQGAIAGTVGGLLGGFAVHRGENKSRGRTAIVGAVVGLFSAVVGAVWSAARSAKKLGAIEEEFVKTQTDAVEQMLPELQEELPGILGTLGQHPDMLDYPHAETTVFHSEVENGTAPEVHQSAAERYNIPSPADFVAKEIATQKEAASQGCGCQER